MVLAVLLPVMDFLLSEFRLLAVCYRWTLATLVK